MTTSTTKALAGAALALSAGLAAGPASTQPRLEQTGDGYSVVYDGERGGDAAGGRAALLLGGGEDRAILYTGPDPAREGRFATLSGGGDDAAISYAEPQAPAAPAPMLAGGSAGRRG